MDDITDRKMITDASYKNAALFELLENHSKITIVKIDNALQAQYVSPSMAHILGYAPEYFIGNSVMDVVYEEDRPGLERQIAEAIQTHAPFLESEYRVRTKTDTIVWMETKASLFYNEQGDFDGAVYIQSDVTDRKDQELRLKEALEEKDYLMRELHHRIKNNLAMISSLISLKDFEISR